MKEGYLGEDAVKVVGNRFDLVIMAAERARELSRGSPARVESKNKPVVTALEEIAEGKYTKEEFLKKIRKGHRE